MSSTMVKVQKARVPNFIHTIDILTNLKHHGRAIEKMMKSAKMDLSYCVSFSLVIYY